MKTKLKTEELELLKILILDKIDLLQDDEDSLIYKNLLNKILKIRDEK